MRGSRLVTAERVVCLAAPDTEDLVDQIRSVATAAGRSFTAYDVGDSIPADDFQGADTLGVVVGGDGTFLRAVTEFSPHEIPIVGVNAGTLGFLTRIPPANVEAAFEEILDGRASVAEHLRCHVSGGGLDDTGINEVTFSPPQSDGRLDCRMEVFVDDEYVGRYEGGGIAINTPTGSTAMALSANGPIHAGTDNETLQVTPLHPRNTAVRPLVVGGQRELTVITTTPVDVSLDGGRPSSTVTDQTRFTVTAADAPAFLVRSQHGRSFMAALADKLDWSNRGPDLVGPPPAQRETTRDERASHVAREAAVSAGEPVCRVYDRVEGTESGSLRDQLVEEAFSRSERIITSILSNAFPDYSIISEGETVHEGSQSETWLVDPLDGTGNFAHGNPSYALSVALVSDGSPVVGVVYSPETGDLFHAVAGQGASRDGAPIAPTDRSRIDESMLLSGYDPTGNFLELFYRSARGVRRLGCASMHLCYVAAGSADGHWEYDTKPWDVAAGLCILREAGGRATDAAGTTYELALDGEGTRTPLLTSNGPLHESLLAHLPADF